jgi:hypothetical protein
MSNVSHNIADLGRVMELHRQLRGVSVREELTKQGGKLNREIYFELLKIAPEAGNIRLELLARLHSGRGIKIRPKVREKNEVKMLRHWVRRLGYRPGRKVRSDVKKLNFQNELVKREIGVRESGRRVLARSVRYPANVADGMRATSRYGQQLSDVGIFVSNDSGTFRLRWSGLSEQGKPVLKGIQRPRAQAAINRAAIRVKRDIMIDVRRRQAGVVTKTVRSMVQRGTRPASGASLQQEIRRVMEGKV